MNKIGFSAFARFSDSNPSSENLRTLARKVRERDPNALLGIQDTQPQQKRIGVNPISSPDDIPAKERSHVILHVATQGDQLTSPSNAPMPIYHSETYLDSPDKFEKLCTHKGNLQWA